MQLARGFSEAQPSRASLEGTQGEQGRWALCGHCAAQPRGSRCSHEFKLSQEGTQIVCGGRGLAVECAGGAVFGELVGRAETACAPAGCAWMPVRWLWHVP